MLSAQRQKRFLDYIAANKSAQVSELGSVFGVSLATVRRDLKEMEEHGLIRRVHGGALLTGETGESPMVQRAAVHAPNKQRIGEAAANLVRDGSTIMLTTGTTTDAMVPFLASKSNLTVITNGINIAYQLSRYPNIAVVVLGGWLRHSELSLLGHLTVQALHDLRADQIFHGTFGIDAEHGLTGTYLPEVQTDRHFMTLAREVVVVADHTKFKQVGSVRLAPIDVVSLVVTDTETPDDKLEALRARGITVIQA